MRDIMKKRKVYFVECQENNSDIINECERFYDLQECEKYFDLITSNNCKNIIYRLGVYEEEFNEHFEDYDIIDNTCDILKEKKFDKFGNEV